MPSKKYKTVSAKQIKSTRKSNKVSSKSGKTLGTKQSSHNAKQNSGTDNIKPIGIPKPKN